MTTIVAATALVFTLGVLASAFGGLLAGAVVPTLVALHLAAVAVGVYGNGFGDGGVQALILLCGSSAAGAVVGAWVHRGRRTREL